MNIENILKKNNNRITVERLSIFNFLKTKHIFSYNDIVSNFKNIGRASIFRTLNLFLDLGVIRKVEIGEKTMTYELNDDKDYHEHMKCEKCNSIISFYSADIYKKISIEAKKIGFEIKSHNIGVFGTCKKCLLTHN